jgi:hypothetical protein
MVSGLVASAVVAFYHVHDLSSFAMAVRHMIHDWYELPAFLAVACPLFYFLREREDSRQPAA